MFELTLDLREVEEERHKEALSAFRRQVRQGMDAECALMAANPEEATLVAEHMEVSFGEISANCLKHGRDTQIGFSLNGAEMRVTADSHGREADKIFAHVCSALQRMVSDTIWLEDHGNGLFIVLSGVTQMEIREDTNEIIVTFCLPGRAPDQLVPMRVPRGYMLVDAHEALAVIKHGAEPLSLNGEPLGKVA